MKPELIEMIEKAKEIWKYDLEEDPTLKLFLIKIDGVGGVKVKTVMVGHTLDEAYYAVVEGVCMLVPGDLSDDGSILLS